jgi:hypothetical protein
LGGLQKGHLQKSCIAVGRGTLRVSPCETIDVVQVDGSVFGKRDYYMFPPFAINELIICLAMFSVSVYNVIGFSTSGNSSSLRRNEERARKKLNS